MIGGYDLSRRDVIGQAGFEGVVQKVAELEKSLGIYDLASFTPAPAQTSQ